MVPVVVPKLLILHWSLPKTPFERSLASKSTEIGLAVAEIPKHLEWELETLEDFCQTDSIVKSIFHIAIGAYNCGRVGSGSILVEIVFRFGGSYP